MRNVRGRAMLGDMTVYHYRAATGENLSTGVCEQHRRRPACASTQSDQRLCYSLIRSIISRLAMREISIFLLVPVAEETGLNIALRETLKTGFVTTRPISYDVASGSDITLNIKIGKTLVVYILLVMLCNDSCNNVLYM